MYARNYKGKIETFNLPPEPLPTDNGLVSGLRRAGADTLANYGIYPIVMPTFDSRTHKLGNLIWDANNSVFTHELISLGATLDDIKQSLKRRLKEDWKYAESEARPYIDYMENNNNTIPTNIENNLKTIFDNMNSIKEEIQALSTLQEALDYEYPESQIKIGLEYVRDLI